MSHSKAERYIAFLIECLPKLQSVIKYMSCEDAERRGFPLDAAMQYCEGNKGVVMEFGVYKGSSLRYLGKKFNHRKFYGFDSFDGFPDDGRNDWTQDFSTGGKLPDVPENVELIKGFFSDSLPDFFSSFDDDIAIINVDCDIYSSTREIFSELGKHGHLKPGLVISFDELINYERFLWNEMLALFEMLEETGLSIEWISAHKKVRGVEEAIDLLLAKKYPPWAEDVENGYRQQASLLLTEKNDPYIDIFELPHCKDRISELAGKFVNLTHQLTPSMLSSIL